MNFGVVLGVSSAKMTLINAEQDIFGSAAAGLDVSRLHGGRSTETEVVLFLSLKTG